jgi:hypothetical protein
MKARRSVVAAIPAVLLAAGSARAEGLAGRFSVSVQAGTQSEVSGQMMRGAQGTLLDKPTTVVSRRYRDVYRPNLRLQGTIGYGIAPKLEVVARGSYYKVKAQGVEAGSFNGSPLFAYFGQVEDQAHNLSVRPHKEYSAELALRYYFAPQSRLKSFVAPVVGARRIEQTLVSLTSPEASSRIMNVPFSEKSTVAVFGVDIGFGFDVTENFYVGLDSGLRYQGAPTPSNSSYLTGIAIDHSSNRWTAPVVAMIGLRF